MSDYFFYLNDLGPQPQARVPRQYECRIPEVHSNATRGDHIAAFYRADEHIQRQHGPSPRLAAPPWSPKAPALRQLGVVETLKATSWAHAASQPRGRHKTQYLEIVAAKIASRHPDQEARLPLRSYYDFSFWRSRRVYPYGSP